MCNNYKLKSWDELTFTDDYMFKLVMSKHPKFISKLLEIRECKIVCVKSNCADLFYAPYWGKQLKGWISNGKT